MTTSMQATRAPAAKKVEITGHLLVLELCDGRTVSVPLDWYPRLADASPEERAYWELIGPGIGIHWPALDEDISVEGVLQGRRSGESAESLNRWRAARSRRTHPGPRSIRGKQRARQTEP